MLSFHKKDLDFNLVLLLAGFYAFFNLLYLGKISFLYGDYIHEGSDMFFFGVLIDYITVLAYMVLIAMSTKRLLYKRYSWTKIITIHTILAIFIGVIIRFTYGLFGVLSGKMFLSDYSFREGLRGFVSVIDTNFLIYFAMVFIIYTYFYVRQVKEARKQRILLEGQLVSARVKLLSSQLQPHFLFNTLNSISVLTDIDPGKAKDTIADLSDFLRESLYSCNDNEISLEKELKTLEYYLNILNVRFSDHLVVRNEIDQGLLPYKVPALLLQPLIENSIKHGYSYDHTCLEILISVKPDGRYLSIKVENTGESLSGDHPDLFKKGMGLSNLEDRLRNLYGEDFFFQISNKLDGAGVQTVIKIPRK